MVGSHISALRDSRFLCGNHFPFRNLRDPFHHFNFHSSNNRKTLQLPFQMNTNPQNFDFDKIETSKGYRLLTPEEFSTLIDTRPANTKRQKLLEHLQPQYYSHSACRWMDAPNLLANSLTYRTRTPLAEHEVETEIIHNDAALDFVESWNHIAAIHHALMRSKGFWKLEDEICDLLDEANRPDLLAAVVAAFDGQKIALQTSEASEALEGLRHGNGPDDKIPQFTAAEAEFADVILRLMDHAYARGWDVAGALVAKFKMNATRANMHGKQF